MPLRHRVQSIGTEALLHGKDAKNSPPMLAPRLVTVEEGQTQQRLDNFLLGQCKGVPKSRVYQMIRNGEVRVNGGRKRPFYKLQTADKVRLPPMRVAPVEAPKAPHSPLLANLRQRLLFEDEHLFILDKPSGMAVHGGNGADGLIEHMQRDPLWRSVELAHRLDKDTSGCLLISKKRSVTRQLHTLFRQQRTEKRYLALVHGHWPETLSEINAPIERYLLNSGERRVRINDAGVPSLTHFRVLQRYPEHTLIEAHPRTGRTHQIRIHTKHSGYPIVGDDKYGGLETAPHAPRLFLHATLLAFRHPITTQVVRVECPLPEPLQRYAAECADRR